MKILEYLLQYLLEVNFRFSRLREKSYLQLLRRRGAQIGKNVFTNRFSTEENFAKLLVIEDDVVFAYGVRVILHDSSMNNLFSLPIKFGRVVIKKCAYVGAKSTIMPGVEIGQGSIIGAGSLVTNNIPPDSVAFGVPARVIGSTNEFKDKFINEMKQNTRDGRFYYLDVKPWRERKFDMSPSSQMDLYNDFLNSIER